MPNNLELYFGASDLQMEAFIDARSFRRSLILNVLFHGDLVLPDIFFYIRRYIYQGVVSDQPLRAFMAEALRCGAMMPAFRGDQNRGRCVLTDPEPVDQETGEATAEPTAPVEPAEPGVELEIQPAGKRLASMALLSGGERARRARVPVRADAGPAVAVLRARRGRRRARRCQHRALPGADRALPRAGAVHRRHPPEAHDGDRRRALRCVDGWRRRLPRALAPARERRGRRAVCDLGRGAARASAPAPERPAETERRRRGLFRRLRENLGR